MTGTQDLAQGKTNGSTYQSEENYRTKDTSFLEETTWFFLNMDASFKGVNEPVGAGGVIQYEVVSG